MSNGRLMPTMQLRFLLRDGKRILQQYNYYPKEVGGVWVDVPFVE